MPDTDAILKSIEEQSTALAKKLFKQFTKQALADTKDYLQKGRGDLERWARQLENKEIDLDDLESLVRGQADLAEMRGLKQAGLAQVNIDAFSKGVLDIAVSTISSAIKIV